MSRSAEFRKPEPPNPGRPCGARWEEDDDEESPRLRTRQACEERRSARMRREERGRNLMGRGRSPRGPSARELAQREARSA